MQQVTKLQQFASIFENEAALSQALVGLLERMPGTTNVRHTHRSNEKGEDIVFDFAGALGQTDLIACVVKKDKITGSVDSSNGARNVYNQAEQSLNLAFTDTLGGACR